jgi:2-keto-4-pentenoate hydratase/2-oxohepta-3-ene-1,7-dioic acid hydratase in catechol pathway
MRIARALIGDRPTLLVEVSAERYVALPALADGRADLAEISDLEGLLEVSGLLADVKQLLEQLSESPIDTVALGDLRLMAPVRRPSAIVCIGRNYMEHIREGDSPVPPYPILFSKFANTLAGSGESVAHPSITTMLDYEGEVAAVIGKTARNVSAADALDYVAGYTIINDISARDLQAEDLQWIRGKSLDGFAPLGPVFVTRDEVPNHKDLRIQTRVNGELRQDDTLASMLWDLPQLIEFVTVGITLQPGDLIATGTPSGTGAGFHPGKYLHPGDEVTVTVEGIGVLATTIAAGESR